MLVNTGTLTGVLIDNMVGFGVIDSVPGVTKDANGMHLSVSISMTKPRMLQFHFTDQNIIASITVNWNSRVNFHTRNLNALRSTANAASIALIGISRY